MKKRKSILYLGIDPSRTHLEGTVTHLPLIAPVPYRHPAIYRYFCQLPHYSSVLLTSRSAVTFYFDWTNDRSKIFYAVGSATAERLKEFGVEALVAKEQTGEGVCELLANHMPENLFFPHALKSRSLIRLWLEKHKVPFCAFPFYETVTVVPESLPNLSQFDAIVFTSPSTIDAFITCYGTLPEDIEWIPIGPVTAAALAQRVPHAPLSLPLEAVSLEM